MYSQHNVPELTVSELAKNLKRVVEDAFGYLKIRGEISTFKKAASGHLYFCLKDQSAVLNAVCFKNIANSLTFEPDNGLEVIASGRITTYEGRSNYQIIIEKLEIAGIGAIMEAIEKRRQKLATEGLFDAKHKKPLPFWPTIIGVITSPAGAVIEDITNRVSQRFPTHLLLYPVTVQGKNAALEVISGINFFNHSQEKRPDVIIIARGGGSFEDLLPFNDEELVRAAFKSAIPIISAIGHETDTTLLDYVSDIRAPTPTAAAEIATPFLSDLKITVTNLEKRLNSYFNNAWGSKTQFLSGVAKRLTHPQSLLNQNQSKLGLFAKQLTQNLASSLNSKERELKSCLALLTRPDYKLDIQQKKLLLLVKNLEHNLKNKLTNCHSRLQLAEKLLNSCNYQKVLARGYALIKNPQGQIITSAKKVKDQERLEIEVSDGNFAAIATLATANNPPINNENS